MKTITTVNVVVIVLAALAAVAVYSGAYNIAADEPHWGVTERVLALVRDRSIEARARELALPDLRDEKRIGIGAGQYAEMCQTCHLAPGIQDTELRQGLYPKPPDLARQRYDPRHAFWVIKHGIKATGMPAWGPTHGDETLWSVVAFLQKLPELDVKAYRDLVGKATPHDAMPAGGGAHERQHEHSSGSGTHRH